METGDEVWRFRDRLIMAAIVVVFFVTPAVFALLGARWLSRLADGSWFVVVPALLAAGGVIGLAGVFLQLGWTIVKTGVINRNPQGLRGP